MAVESVKCVFCGKNFCGDGRPCEEGMQINRVETMNESDVKLTPEKIFIEQDDGCPYFYTPDEEMSGPVVAYIRADLVEEFHAWASKMWPDPGGNNEHPWNKLVAALAK